MRRWWLAGCSLVGVFATASPEAYATPEPDFLVTGPVGPIVAPTTGPHAGSHGGTITRDVHGLLVVEREAGVVIRAGLDGTPHGRVELHAGLGEIVGDGLGVVFVADRSADRVVRLSPGDGAGAGLAVAGELAITEPHGLALTADGATLLVTSVADHQLVAVDTAKWAVRWRVELTSEPRGVAVTRDGSQAIVGFLTTGALAVVDLASAGKRVRWHSLNPRDTIDVIVEEDPRADMEAARAEISEARSRYQVPASTGKRYARVFPTIAIVGGDRVVAPHQISTPQLVRKPDATQNDSYGGLAQAEPIEQHMAMIRRPGAPQAESLLARLELHQPRALAYDLASDTLFIGGYGDDAVVAIAEVSQQAPYMRWRGVVSGGPGEACGIDGLVLAGEQVWVHCALTRRLAAIAVAKTRKADSTVKWTMGPPLAVDTRDRLVARGAELFRRGGDPQLSGGGIMACASCHPEGRDDGLTWRLGPSILQTPMLAGRVQGTGPFKWDGQDRDLRASVKHTIDRLGGSSERLTGREVEALVAFIEALPRPRARGDLDAAALTRGRALFTSEVLACDDCHAGASLVDGVQHPLKGSLAQVDTPSLIGLGHSAPYYHDGSADSLTAVLGDRGSVHDMVDPAALKALSPTQTSDLIAYLASL